MMRRKRRKKERGRCGGEGMEGSSEGAASREGWTGSGQGGCDHYAISRFYENKLKVQ